MWNASERARGVLVTRVRRTERGTESTPPLKRRFVDALLWVASVALMVALVILSLIPQPPIGGPRPTDLLLHVAAYAPTTFMLLLAAVWRPGRGMGPFPNSAVAVIVALMVLGAALEGAQALGWAGPRQGEVTDVIANVVGVGTGGLGWRLLRATA